MYSNKISPFVQLALKYEELLTPEIRELFVVPGEKGKWEVIVEYVGSIEHISEEIDAKVTFLGAEFALIVIAKKDIIRLAEYPNVVYIAFSLYLQYTALFSTQICMTGVSKKDGMYGLTGAGTLIAVVDTGIDYSHSDFITSAGASRIASIWDQTIKGNPPEGFDEGTEYTREQINAALLKPTKEEQLQIVPSQDDIGHGTAMAGIAAGNGNASNGLNAGVAPQSELLIVKVGPEGGSSEYPKTRQIMLGIHYVVEKAKKLNKPLVVLLGIGSNLTGHDGKIDLERYIDRISNTWKCNFVVGTGNQGNKGSHASGRFETGKEEVIEIFIDASKRFYSCVLWTSAIDQVGIVIESPSGQESELITSLTPNRAFILGNTAVLVDFAIPSIDIKSQSIFILFQAQEGAQVDRGIWRIEGVGIDVLIGDYNIWLSVISPIGSEVDNTRFLNATINMSLMSPSTAENITSVAAYSGLTNQLAPFSGRGFTRDNRIKPDITAPGINILAPSIKSNMSYELVSGTSAAAAFTAGAYAILMQYAILQLGLTYLYGEALKLYIIKNANRPISNGPYPNEAWGFGTLCVEAALNNIREDNVNV